MADPEGTGRFTNAAKLRAMRASGAAGGGKERTRKAVALVRRVEADVPRAVSAVRKRIGNPTPHGLAALAAASQGASQVVGPRPLSTAHAGGRELTGRGIAVYCSSSDAAPEAYFVVARALGRALAQAHATGVYGGASVGLMGAVADAALAEGGHVVGVIPQRIMDREIGHAPATTAVWSVPFPARRSRGG